MMVPSPPLRQDLSVAMAQFRGREKPVMAMRRSANENAAVEQGLIGSLQQRRVTNGANRG